MVLLCHSEERSDVRIYNLISFRDSHVAALLRMTKKLRPQNDRGESLRMLL